MQQMFFPGICCSPFTTPSVRICLLVMHSQYSGGSAVLWQAAAPGPVWFL